MTDTAHTAREVLPARHLRRGSYIGTVVAWRSRLTDDGAELLTVCVRLAHSAGQPDMVEVVLHRPQPAHTDAYIRLGDTVLITVRRVGELSDTALDVLDLPTPPTSQEIHGS